MPVTEALLSGLPVLANDIPEIREAGGSAATYYAAEKHEDLAKILSMYYSSHHSLMGEIPHRKWCQAALIYANEILRLS